MNRRKFLKGIGILAAMPFVAKFFPVKAEGGSYLEEHTFYQIKHPDREFVWVSRECLTQDTLDAAFRGVRRTKAGA